MGQILFKDKIGTLSESSGTITLAASKLTIGGQQYQTSALNVAGDYSSLNTRYQIYAVVSGGSVSLVVSQNENSVGPAGHSAWKLVGSYYSNGVASTGFGSFVSITGRPVSGAQSFDLVIGAATTPPTRGNVLVENNWWKRDGKYIIYSVDLRQDSAGSAGSGSYFWNLPTNLLADVNALNGVNHAPGKKETSNLDRDWETCRILS